MIRIISNRPYYARCSQHAFVAVAILHYRITRSASDLDPVITRNSPYPSAESGISRFWLCSRKSKPLNFGSHRHEVFVLCHRLQTRVMTTLARILLAARPVDHFRVSPFVVVQPPPPVRDHILQPMCVLPNRAVATTPCGSAYSLT